MRKRTFVLGAVLGMSMCMGTHAEPEPHTKEMVDGLIKQMEYQLESQTELMSDPKILEALATQKYLYYQALVKAGFSKDQAMQLIVASAQANKS